MTRCGLALEVCANREQVGNLSQWAYRGWEWDRNNAGEKKDAAVALVHVHVHVRVWRRCWEYKVKLALGKGMRLLQRSGREGREVGCIHRVRKLLWENKSDKWMKAKLDKAMQESKHDGIELFWFSRSGSLLLPLWSHNNQLIFLSKLSAWWLTTIKSYAQKTQAHKALSGYRFGHN